MPSPYPHLIVRRTAVKPTPLTSSRNLLAIQSALIRGDRVVTLHNTSRLLPEHYNNVRVPYEPEDMPQDQPLEWPFGDQYADPSSGVTSQPRLVDRFIDLLDWDGFRLEWIKVLGEGGFGMATLWDAIFEDQSRVKVVIKIPVRVNSDFDSELDWHLRYGGASHVTQSLDLQAMADSVRRRIGRGYMVGRGPRFVQTDLSVLVLEYAERGSLYEMMSKASYFGINFSNKALWEIWECLVKGVVSVAFQPDAMKRWGRDGLDGLLDALDDPKNINELIKISTLINSHDVHFDLEEQNVLVSEDDQHLHHPIFKLHDFGEFSKRMRECWIHWKEADYWKVRRCPKTNRTPPETISKDWDKVDLNNPGRVSRYTGDFFGPRLNEVAGRYGTWTNVFMIGKIMESIITKNWLGHPMNTIKYTAQNQRCSGPSYGWRVCRPDYDYIEAELLDLIVQCQFEKPKDRPHLGYLLKKIYERKHRGFQETDYETRCFWDAFWARTKTNPTPTGLSTGQPPVPLSQTSTAAASGSGGQGNNTTGQHPNGSLPSTLPFPQGSNATSRNTQPPPHSPSRYAQTGNPLIAHVAALRRKSRRSPLSVSSTDSSISLAPRTASAPGQQAAGFDPAASPPPSSPAAPARGTAAQRKRPSPDDDPPRTEESSRQAKKRKQKRVRFGEPPASPSLATTISPSYIMDDSMGDSPGSLDRAWPVVSNTWMPVPNFLDDDADDVRNLSTLYSAISPQRSRAPQSSNGRDFAAGSPRPASGRATSRASRLQQQWDIITGPVTSSAEAFAPLQAIPERGAGAMDLDEEISDGYTMGEFWGVVNGEGGEVS